MKKIVSITVFILSMCFAAHAQYAGGHEDGYAMTQFSAVVFNSVQEQGAASFVVYPNPVSHGEELFINGDLKGETVCITITDLPGRVVYSIVLTAADDKVTIPLKGISQGAYLVSIRTSSGTSSRKIFIE